MCAGKALLGEIGVVAVLHVRNGCSFSDKTPGQSPGRRCM